MDNTHHLERSTEVAEDLDKRFTDFALAPDVIEMLSRAGIEHPTPIQEKCIPPILEGKDLVGKADTGTGKTIGFGAPIVSRIDTQRVAAQAIVLTPTRELAQQVAGVLEDLGRGRNLRVALVVGGVHASEQVLELRKGAQVVVGTPGRVLEFLQDRTLSLVWCDVAVLDEADRMLDMGFIDDVTKILDRIPQERQTLLFSATLPPEVKSLLHRYMKSPEIHSTSQGLTTVPEIRQLYVEAEFPRKFRELEKILKSYENDTVLIFCNTRRQAIDLDRMLWGHGYNAGALHGDHEQEVRFRVLKAYRTGDIKILVATDVASRGLDVDDIACVVNYEIPDDPGGYVHRIGRTGRAKKRGAAISIVSGKEWGLWERILRETKFTVERMGPERVRKHRGSGRAPREEGEAGGGRPRGRRPRVQPRGRGGRARRPSSGRSEHRLRTGPVEGDPGFTEARAMDSDTEERTNEPTSAVGADAFEAGDDVGAAPGSVAGAEPPEGQGEEGQPGSRGAEGRDRDARRGRRRRRRGRGGGDVGSELRHGAAGRAPREDAREETSSRKGGAPGHGDSRRGEEGALEASQSPGDAGSAGYGRESARRERPARARLADLDDDFVKTDYFSVDHSIIQRSQTVRRSSDPDSRAGARAPGQGRRSEQPGRGARGGSQASTGRGGGQGGPGGRGPHAEGPRRGDPETASGEKGPAGQGRRRRRRRRRPKGQRGGAAGDNAAANGPAGE